MRDEYADGVWQVELGPLSDPKLVTQTVGEALSIHEEPKRPFLQTLIETLKPKRLLLILDNCEHLVDACAEVVDALIRHCSGLSILATSRESLRVAGELARRVPSLSVPEADHDLSVARLMEYESVRLFAERSRASNVEFVITESDAPYVAQICRRLDGIPLAIELAAARTVALSPEQIAARLDNRFKLLTGGRRTALKRQKTLEAAVAWSYELLEADERRLFDRLGVFSGAFDLGAVESVCTDEEIEEWLVLDLLTQLVDKSLVVTLHERDTLRYQLLETLKTYAVGRLNASDEDETVRRRHFEFYLALAHEAEPETEHGPRQGEWLNRLHSEMDNIRAALLWSLEHDSMRALDFAGSLGRFWYVRAYWSEAGDYLRRALKSALAAPADLRCTALWRQGMMASQKGDYAAESELYEQALALARQTSNDRLAAGILNSFGVLASDQADYELARSRLQESLTLARKWNDRLVLSRVLNNLALILYWQGDFVRSRELLLECLELERELNDRYSEGIALANLGYCALQTDQLDEARTLLDQAREICIELGNKYTLASTLTALGNWSCVKQDYGEAEELYRESLQVCRASGHRQYQGLALLSLGDLAFIQKDLGVARDHFSESILIARDMGLKLYMAQTLEGFAKLAVVLGDAHHAATLFGAADSIRETISSPVSPVQRLIHDENVELALTALGKQAFDSAWNKGREMTIEQSVMCALQQQ